MPATCQLNVAQKGREHPPCRSRKRKRSKPLRFSPAAELTPYSDDEPWTTALETCATGCLAPQRPLGSLHNHAHVMRQLLAATACPPCVGTLPALNFAWRKRWPRSPAHAGSKVAHRRAVASSTSRMPLLSRSKPCSPARVVVASMASTIARPAPWQVGLLR